MNKKTRNQVETVSNFIVSVGAAIVILGALAKLTHHRWADTMLTVGLLTEAAIFIMYAFLPPTKTHEEELLNSIYREIKFLEKVPQMNSISSPATLDSEPIDNLNKTLKQIFNLKNNI